MSKSPTWRHVLSAKTLSIFASTSPWRPVRKFLSFARAVPGNSVEGLLLRRDDWTQEGEARSAYVIELTEPCQISESDGEGIAAAGQCVAVNAKANLRGLSELLEDPVLHMVRIKYLGKEKIAGGKTPWKFDIHSYATDTPNPAAAGE